MSLVCLSQKRFPNCNTKVTLAEGPGLRYHLMPDLCSDTPGGLQNVCLNEDPNLAYMGRLASFLQPLSIPSRPTLPPSAPPCQRDSSTQSDCFPGISFSLFLDPLLHMFREVQVRAKGVGSYSASFSPGLLNTRPVPAHPQEGWVTRCRA